MEGTGQILPLATIESKRTAPLGPFCFPGPGIQPSKFTLLLATTPAAVSHHRMGSQLADAARRRLSEDVKRMTPEQRLDAFLAHCQLMAQLHRAGGAVQQRPQHVATIANRLIR